MRAHAYRLCFALQFITKNELLVSKVKDVLEEVIVMEGEQLQRH